ncbi:hypothetical protein [Halomonas stenophila]|uniref:Uncharacterized protein n=1 Tax=Halomonas stenophila TaxID=795312 RepID=A0A7W5EV30_9GAMM|nr:hypothetical protein [Halomonas stenophila]MBB3231948.1 hypothetical protein [Halomonas stenophila]
MRTVIASTLALSLMLPVAAKASVCHMLADFAEEMMRTHQFPGERSGYNVHESVRRMRDPQLKELVDKIQYMVWTSDRYITDTRRTEAVHDFSQEIYDMCMPPE